MVIFIILLAAVLRLYNFTALFNFGSEHGIDLLRMKEAYFSHTLPLVGQPTSHPWFYLGPWYYWLFIPIMAGFSWNPLAHGYAMAFGFVATIVLNWVVVDRVFGKRIALASSLMLASSAEWIIRSSAGFYNFLVVPLFYPFFFATYRKKWALAALVLGLMFNFHPASIILIPLLVVLSWVDHRRVSQVVSVIGGFALAQLPLVIYDARSGFQMWSKFGLWVGYRSLGLAPTHPAERGFSPVDFLTRPVIYDVGLLQIIVVGFLLWGIVRSAKELGNYGYRLAMLLLGWGVLGLLVHRNPPDHYYYFIFPLPVVVFVYFLARWWKRWLYPITVAVVFLNLGVLFSPRWYFRPPEIALAKVPYAIQLRAAAAIVADAAGRDFALRRRGPFAEFPGEYAYNWRYLLWWLGNEPKAGAARWYTVYESEAPDRPDAGRVIYSHPNLTVRFTD